MPPLTRYGWTLPFEAWVELAEHWGYALESGGYATGDQVKRDLADRNRMASKLCALTASDPKKHPLAVIVSRELPKDVLPESWTRDAEGRRSMPKRNPWMAPCGTTTKQCGVPKLRIPSGPRQVACGRIRFD